MRKTIYSFVSMFFCLLASLGAQLDFPDKHPLDKSEYRRLTLDNGLKVILLSDPKLNVSSAAMCVSVGAMSDPDGRSGLAHFLEHMLFLGTEKFPEAGEYGKYLKTNGGYSNAYTSSDHTNYHFQVYHDAFEGALTRFSQFFIAPLFTEEFTKREMNAVNSEHQKNLQNDTWRQLQIRRTLYNPKHPANNFSTGSLETLGGIQRPEFLDFYKKYYSANQMTLALCGKEGLDQLEAWARNFFSPIENRDRPDVKFSSDYLLPEKAFRLVHIEPVKDIRTLSLEFPTPPGVHYYESKPSDLLSFIIGHEGGGSLLSYLKNLGLATGLGAYGYDPAREYGSFFIRVELTPKGLEQYRDVVSHIFSYIQVLKDAGYPLELFREQSIMGRLEELYSDKGEGTGLSTGLANNLRLYPLEIAERVPYLWTKEDPAVYRKFLDSLRPDNFLCILASKGLETDKTEKYYGTKYSFKAIDDAVYKKLSHPRKIPALHLPKPNPYLPKSLQQLGERPVKLIDEKGLTLYYSQDTEFQRPKVTITFQILQSEKDATLRNIVLKGLYADCVNEALNEESYPAAMAGLSYGFSAGLGGVNLTVSGYSLSAMKLLEKVIATMKGFDISEERFESLKERTVRALENFPKGDAWRLARHHKNHLQEKVFFTPEQQLALIGKVTLKSVRDFARKQLYRQGKIEGLVHGNLTAKEAVAAATNLQDQLGLRPISNGGPYEKELLVMKPGETLLRTHKLEVNNSAFWREYDIALDVPATRAATLVIDNFVSQPFYNEMRTKQQLGYIVWGGASRKEDRLQAYFIIQSGTHPADELQRRADAFLVTFPDKFANLTDQEFDRLKNAAREKVKEKPKSIAEKAGGLYSRAYDHEGDFDREQATLRAIDQLTKAQTLKILHKMLGEKTRSQRTFLLFAKEHKPKSSIPSTFENLEKWKATRQFK
jgi:insulysin